jgi:transcriptional regulator with XRE-family HTH domain
LRNIGNCWSPGLRLTGASYAPTNKPDNIRQLNFIIQMSAAEMGAVVTDTENEEKSSRRANPVDVHVGSRVRLRRMLLGMSQEKLGERLGLTFQQVQKYEKGVNRIGASRLYELAKVLGVSISFFYDEAPESMSAVGSAGTVPGFSEMPAESYAAEFLSSREGLELNKAFAKIADPKVRRTIVDLVRSLANEEANKANK